MLTGEPTARTTTLARPRPSPWPVLAATATAVVLLVVAAQPLLDVDLYWHLLVGEDILGGVPVREAGRGWSFAPVPDTWVSTQWLSEVLLTLWYRVLGWNGLLLWRLLSTAAVLAGLWWATTRAPRPVRSAWAPYTIAALLLVAAAQERSQQVTYVLAPLLGLVLVRALRDGRLPRWWVVVPVVVVWANLHGGWVLAAITLGLAALGRVVDHGVRDRSARSAALLAVLAYACGALTPLGWSNLWSPLTFSRAAASIVEWQRVTPFHPFMVPMLVLLVVLVALWARGPVRPPRSELVVVALLVLLAMVAWRNVTPVTLMLAPMLAFRIGDSLTGPDRPVTPLLGRAAVGIVAAGAAVAVVAALTTPPLPDDLPVRLVDRIASLPGDQRVVNDYNKAGAVLWFGGPPRVRVAIDGRTDRHGGTYIAEYADMVAMRPGWQDLFDRLDPTAVMLPEDAPLVAGLVAERSWREVDRQGGEVLLLPPAP